MCKRNVNENLKREMRKLDEQRMVKQEKKNIKRQKNEFDIFGTIRHSDFAKSNTKLFIKNLIIRLLIIKLNLNSVCV